MTGAVATIGAVTRKELRQIVRDRRTLLIQIFVPVFGYALNFDIRHIALAVEDRDGTSDSRALVSAFVNSGYFDRVATVHDPGAKDRLLDTNEARAILTIPEGSAETCPPAGAPPCRSSSTATTPTPRAP